MGAVAARCGNPAAVGDTSTASLTPPCSLLASRPSLDAFAGAGGIRPYMPAGGLGVRLPSSLESRRTLGANGRTCPSGGELALKLFGREWPRAPWLIIPFTSCPTLDATLATPTSVLVRNSLPRPSPLGASELSQCCARSATCAAPPALAAEVDRARCGCGAASGVVVAVLGPATGGLAASDDVETTDAGRPGPRASAGLCCWPNDRRGGVPVAMACNVAGDVSNVMDASDSSDIVIVTEALVPLMGGLDLIMVLDRRCWIDFGSYLTMGRSAKMMKRPTQKQKAASKIAKAAARPLSPPVKEAVELSEGQGQGPAAKSKKRKMLRVKADKVSRSSYALTKGQDQVEH